VFKMMQLRMAIPESKKVPMKKIIEATEKAFNLETGSIKMDTMLKRLQPGRI
jgi:hypothetical protein